MLRPRYRWQLIVFVGAILLPSAALVVVGQRTLQQNRELVRLAGQRAARERIAREMLARLENLKRTATLDPAAPDSPVALVAPIESGRLLLPWESDPPARRFRELTATPPAFATSIERGEQAQFSGGPAGAAVRSYREALRLSRTPLQSAYARLLLARALDKQGRTAEAVAEARQILNVPAEVMDEDGVPLCVHAAALLLASPPDRPALRRALTPVAGARLWHSPAATFTLSNLAGQLQQIQPPEDPAWMAGFRARIAAAIQLQEQVQALQNDAARLGLLEPSPNGGPWTFYPGFEPWLAGSRFAAGQPGVVVAVRAREVFQPFEAAGNLRFFPSADPGGELLADNFPGLKVLFAPAGPSGLAGGFYYGALFVLVGATAFGTYLLWRSLRGEMELAETRSQFVASVSHELKTPLTAIRMYAETLQMGRSQDKEVQNEYLETICNESERLSRLVDDVLLFSKIEQDRMVYRFRPADLGDILRRAARTLSYPLAQRGFELRLDLEEDLPPVNADPDALGQAVLNLLTNAMKYSGEKKEIGLRLARRNGEAAIQVSDYGIGIAAEDRARIFEKYYRAATPENQTIPGTGLGLTVVAQIVKAHGGSVDVESVPGQGSTFSIRLPLSTHVRNHGDVSPRASVGQASWPARTPGRPGGLPH